MNGASGLVLAEAYDETLPAQPYGAIRLINISANAQTSGGDRTLTVGFSVNGGNTKHVLIRAIGPGLAIFNVNGTLPDPVLTVYAGSTVVGLNQGWNSDLGVASACDATGAFLPPSRNDSALCLTLPAGTYTAQVTSAGGSSGTSLLEVYEVP